MNKCFYRKLSHALSGLLVSVVHIVMTQCYKGYMNIVDIFGSLPSTQLNRFIYYYVSVVPTVLLNFPLSLSLHMYNVGDCSKEASVTSLTKFYSYVANMGGKQ